MMIYLIKNKIIHIKNYYVIFIRFYWIINLKYFCCLIVLCLLYFLIYLFFNKYLSKLLFLKCLHLYFLILKKRRLSF